MQPSEIRNVMTLFVLSEGNSNFTSLQPGSVTGLNMVLNAEHSDYLVANSAGAGFRVRANLQSLLYVVFHFAR